MSDKILSVIYADACSRCAQASTQLYESLHDDKGSPLYDAEDVAKAVAAFRVWINIELDLIKEVGTEPDRLI